MKKSKLVKICVFQEPVQKGWVKDDYGWGCFLLSTHTGGVKEPDCNPEICPHYQTWKALEKLNRDWKD